MDEDDDEGDDEHDDEDEIDKRATWAKGCRNSLNHTHTHTNAHNIFAMLLLTTGS